MSTPAVEISGLWKRFRKGGAQGMLWESLARAVRSRIQGRPSGSDVFWALQDVNLSAFPGEALGVIGPNGAGKSTLLKVLSHILRPDRGAVSIHGRLSGLIEVGAGFHGDLTGRENIFINGAILGMKRAEIRRKFDAIVEFAGIREFLDMPVKRYSSGMYVRLGFSVAAHMDPDILLVDEVLSVGDVTFKARCMDVMRNFLRRGTCVLFVSHNLSAVKRFCDRVVLLDHGKVRCSGRPDDAIAEYSRLISDLEDANPEGVENSNIGGQCADRGPARLTGVHVLNADGQPARRFIAGEPMRVVIEYDRDAAASNWEPNFIVSVHLFGAGLFYQFDSRRDGLHLEPGLGRGAVAVDLPRISLGEGIYQIGVAMADERGLPAHDWHDRAYRIQVVSDGVTEGAVYQQRQWHLLETESSEPARSASAASILEPARCSP